MVQEVIKALRKNNFKAEFFATREEAKAYLLSLVPSEGSIGFGGSQTLQQLELASLFEKNEYQILNHNAPGVTKEEAIEIRRKQLVCDLFLTSANAITQDGRLVNTDGTGNRAAAMIFGPKTIVIIAGTNKIVADVEAAYERIKAIAAPQNNKRLSLPNPCTTTGTCIDCSSQTRICNVTTVMNKKPTLSDIHVIIIDEALGY